MNKVPSYIKGPAETRARSASEVNRLKRLQIELSDSLTNAVADVGACDRFIRKFDPRLNPELIESRQAHKGRYGVRGAGESIRRYVQEAAPQDRGMEPPMGIYAPFSTLASWSPIRPSIGATKRIWRIRCLVS